MDPDASALSHLVCVSRQTEAGDIRRGVQAGLDRGPRCRAIRRDHRRDRRREIFHGEVATLVRGRENTRADGFREPHGVADAKGILPQDALRMNPAGHGETELRLAIDDRVAARDDATRVAHGVHRAGEHALKLGEWRVLGPRSDLKREQDLAAHREHVGHRIGCRDRARCVRVVDDRWEEVERLDDRDIGRDEVHRGVVGMREADEQLRGRGL